MVMKRSIPTWSVVLTIVLALAAVAGYISTINPTADKEALLKLRTKPVVASGAATAPNGMPRGTPINHAPPSAGPSSRDKPTGS